MNKYLFEIKYNLIHYIRIILILLYLFIKFLSIKLITFLKFYFVPIPLTLAVFTESISVKFSIAITIIIYSTIIYDYFTKLMIKMYGNFGNSWWFRFFLTLYANCIALILYFTFGTLENYSYVLVALFSPILISVFIGKMLLNMSRILEWDGPLPYFYTNYRTFDKIENIKKVYNNESEENWLKKKLERFILTTHAGLSSITVCVFVGVILFIFLKSTHIFIVYIIIVLFYDIHSLLVKGRLFKFKNYDILKLIDLKDSIENKILPYFSPEDKYKQPFLKRIGVSLCLIIGFGTSMINNSIYFVIYLPIILKNYIYPGNNIFIFYVDVMFSLYAISFILMLLFQSYYWYTLILRIPQFIEICIKRDFSTRIVAPMLPNGGFQAFIINNILTLFCMCFPIIFVIFQEYLFAPDPAPIEYVYTYIFIFIFISSFEIFLILSTLKNKKLKEIIPTKLYKDNLRLPLSSLIQVCFFAILSSIFQYLNSENIYSIIITNFSIVFVISYSLILMFYVDDIIPYLCRKKKPCIKLYGLYFSWGFFIFIWAYLEFYYFS